MSIRAIDQRFFGRNLIDTRPVTSYDPLAQYVLLDFYNWFARNVETLELIDINGSLETRAGGVIMPNTNQESKAPFVVRFDGGWAHDIYITEADASAAGVGRLPEGFDPRELVFVPTANTINKMLAEIKSTEILMLEDLYTAVTSVVGYINDTNFEDDVVIRKELFTRPNEPAIGFVMDDGTITNHRINVLRQAADGTWHITNHHVAEWDYFHTRKENTI